MAGPDKGKQLPINQDVVTMGRGHDNNFVLNDISVSRNHARLERLDGGSFPVGGPRQPKRHLLSKDPH
ncbi:MAG: FHA domain-containing protein [Limnochordia bacterium]